MKRFFQNISVLFITLFISFWVLDIFVRNEELYDKGTMTDSSILNREAWLERKHFDAKIEGYVDLYDNIDLFNDTLGWVPKPNMSNFQGKYSTVQDGIRSDKPISKSKPDSVYRILTIGDSFTWGEEVITSNTFQMQTEKQFKNVEFVNIGVHGYGHDQMLIRLSKIGLQYKPDMVILGCVNEDLPRNGIWFRDYYKPKFNLKKEKLVLGHVPITATNEVLSKSKFSNKTFNYIRAKFDDIITKRDYINYNTCIDIYDLNYAILDSMNSLCKQNNAQFTMLYMPNKVECIQGKAIGNIVYSNYAKENKIEYLDFTKDIGLKISNNNDSKQEILKGYSHWHPSIHRYLASGISSYLVTNKRVK